jgi:glycerol-1-phosphate dehydrogenase [NAD(P)+]
MHEVLETVLTRFAGLLDTRTILLERGALRHTAAVLRDDLPIGKWMVVVDRTTLECAGQEIADGLAAAGLEAQIYHVPCRAGEREPMCDDLRVDACREALSAGEFVAAVAVGSGTINDIVKLSSFQLDLPMAAVATAPSMNGYTSGIAAVLSDGVKTTVGCRAPRTIIADLDVLAEAPARMIQSGLGDLVSKPVSNSDWLLSAELNGTYHSADAMEVIEAGARCLDGVAQRLPSRDREAIGGLTASLMLSGLAMRIAGSSSPASGGEHLISHYIDMTAHTFDLPHDFHGCQVGVGTLTTALFYERLLEMNPEDIDLDECARRHVPWAEYREILRERFGPLFEAVARFAEPGYPSRAELCQRVGQLVARWPEITAKVGRTLRTRKEIEKELHDAGCPLRFSDLGVTKERARRAIVESKDIRNRYTILHLAWELGTLETWADEAMSVLYDAPSEH